MALTASRRKITTARLDFPKAFFLRLERSVTPDRYGIEQALDDDSDVSLEIARRVRRRLERVRRAKTSEGASVTR